MTVKELMKHLQAANPKRDVLIYDASADAKLPIDHAKLPYGGPVILVALRGPR